MFYVYVLQSTRNNDVYVGYSSDLRKRFRAHNDGKVQSTKGYIPWDLIYYEAYKNKKVAIKREKELKQHKAKDDLKKRLFKK